MEPVRSLSSLFSPPVEPAAPIAVVGGRDVEFGEFERDVAALAARLRDHEQSRWMVVSEDAYAIAVGFIAALHAGKVTVLPANLQLGHLTERADQVGGFLKHEQRVPAAVDVLPILGCDPSGPRLPLGSLALEDARVILHTSGTTGGPEPVEKSLKCFEEELIALGGLFRRTDPQVVLATVPAHHIYGLLFRVLWPLVAGRPFVAELIRFPAELVKALEVVERGLLVSSPAFLTRALKVLDIAALRDRVCGVFSSGGPLPPEVAADYSAKLVEPVIEVYGSTETGGVGYRSVRDAGIPEPWTPLPGVTLAVEPESGALTVKSPFLIKRERFLTGDTARLLPDGRFELRGRADRIVKVEERRISLSEVEQRLASTQEVLAARVIPLRDANGRMVLGAVIVPSPEGWTQLAGVGKRALSEALRAALMPYLDLAALPRKWRFVRKLPVTAQGKAPVSLLLALFDGDADAVTQPILLDREVGPSTARLELELPPDLLYFDGHFDGHPILPGVVQLDWAIGFAREEFALGERFRKIEALKFFRVLFSGERVTLDLRFDREKERLHFRYRSQDHDHSAGRIHFEARP